MALLLAASILTFSLVALAPGKAFDELRLDPHVPPGTAEALRARYGLDGPFPLRFLRWFGSVARGDFGFSISYRTAAGPLLWERARNTLLLGGLATALAWLLALALGVTAANRRGSRLDRILSTGLTALLVLPEIAIAIALLVITARTGWLPAGGMLSPHGPGLDAGLGALGDLARHLVLPVAVLVAGALPALERHVRSSVAEALDAPFASAALARGISRRALLWRHCLRYAANPLLSLLGISLGRLLSASLVVEVIFGWPGLGPLLLGAIFAHDADVVAGCVLLSTVLFLAGSGLADALLLVVDPRLREAER